MLQQEPKSYYSPPPPSTRAPKESPSNETREAIARPEESSSLGKSSSFDPVGGGGGYDPKEAMQRRFDGLREACLGFGDFMRPEKFIVEVVPEKEGVRVYICSNCFLLRADETTSPALAAIKSLRIACELPCATKNPTLYRIVTV